MPMIEFGCPPDRQCLDNFDRLWVRRDRCVLGSEHLCGTQHHHWEMHSTSWGQRGKSIKIQQKGGNSGTSPHPFYTFTAGILSCTQAGMLALYPPWREVISISKVQISAPPLPSQYKQRFPLFFTVYMISKCMAHLIALKENLITCIMLAV